MNRNKIEKASRRDFVRLAVTTAAFGPFFSFPDRTLSGQRSLKIAKWAHFLPEFDQWFVKAMAEEWGKRNDTKVIVDLVPIEEIRTRALGEVRAGKGHDLFVFPWPPAEFSSDVIDHAEIYQAVAPHYGAIQQLAHRSTFNFKSKTYFAFADFWIPTPLQFFQDYWAQAGLPLGPVHYGGLLSGGKKIKDNLGIPCGLALSPTLEGNVTLHTLLYAFRAWPLDGDGNLLFNRNVFAVQALKYIQQLYHDTGTQEQLAWGPAGNVAAMLARRTSCSMNGVGLLRTAEKENPATAKQIWIQVPLLGRNGMGVTALPHVTNCSAIWNFAQNTEGAKKFVAHLADISGDGYDQSKGCNFPIYPKAVPDLVVRLEKDAQSYPPYKYYQLKDALHWTPNLGVPGVPTPAYMEIFNTSVVPRMVARMLKGEQSAEDAAASGAAEIQQIIEKWKQMN